MKLKYLGTAASEGWPALFCNCSSCVKAKELGGKNIRTRAQALVDESILIDFGPDTYMHALHYQIPFYKIKHCIITHSHSDHFYPTDLMLKGYPYAINGNKSPLTVYGNAKVKSFYNHMLEAENDCDSLSECVRFVEIEAEQKLQIEGYKITPLVAKHDPRETCFIYFIEDDKGKTILYANDTAYFPEQTWTFLEGKKIDLLSLDATMGKLNDCPTHMGFETAFKTKERLTKMNCLHENSIVILNHFSHNQGDGLMHKEMETIAAEKNCKISFDGMEVDV